MDGNGECNLSKICQIYKSRYYVFCLTYGRNFRENKGYEIKGLFGIWRKEKTKGS